VLLTSITLEIENFKFSKVKLKCKLFLKDIFVREGNLRNFNCNHRKIENIFLKKGDDEHYQSGVIVGKKEKN